MNICAQCKYYLSDTNNFTIGGRCSHPDHSKTGKTNIDPVTGLDMNRMLHAGQLPNARDFNPDGKCQKWERR